MEGIVSALRALLLRIKALAHISTPYIIKTERRVGYRLRLEYGIEAIASRQANMASRSKPMAVAIRDDAQGTRKKSSDVANNSAVRGIATKLAAQPQSGTTWNVYATKGKVKAVADILTHNIPQIALMQPYNFLLMYPVVWTFSFGNKGISKNIPKTERKES